jgi:ferritin-like metal-binding protein YciE
MEAEMPLTEPQDLFVHELGDLLYAERTLQRVLPTLAREAEDQALRLGIQMHERETREQVRRLERVLELLGETAQAEKCPGIDGIIEEHDELVRKEQPTGAATCPWSAQCFGASTTRSPPTPA